MKTLAVAVTVSALALTSLAHAKPVKRHKQPAPAADWRANATSQQAARMIEVRPGYWISSFGCAQDAGYGRFTPCDLTDGNAR